MMRRFAALFIAFGLTACSGGGSKTTPPAPTKQQSAARGTMTLKVTYSALHHVTSAKRSPKFVDGSGAILNVTTFTEEGGSTGEAFPVAPGPDGSQTLSLSTSSTNFGVINIFEADTDGTVLAAGSTSFSLAPGATVSAAATLDMAPNGIVIADSLTPLNVNAVLASDILTASPSFAAPSGAEIAPPLSCSSTFFIAATDAIGGFQNTAGAISGITPAVTIVSQVGGSTLTAGPFPGEFTRSSNFPETVEFQVLSSSNQGFANYFVFVAFPDCT